MAGKKMQRSLYLFGSLLVLVVLAFACDGGGGGDEPTVAPTASPEASPEDTPGASPTAVVRPSPVVTALPGITTAIVPPDLPAFLEEFAEENPTILACSYDGETGLVDCTSVHAGELQLVPPVAGEGVECEVIVLNVPIGVICNSTEPAFASIYQVSD